jgi:DNA-binding FrmR family transcriptional regulator
MTREEQKKLVGRLRRIAGQIRALEQAVERENSENVTNQFLASIAALKGSLRFYLERELLGTDQLSEPDRALLARLLNRVD